MNLTVPNGAARDSATSATPGTERNRSCNIGPIGVSNPDAPAGAITSTIRTRPRSKPRSSDTSRANELEKTKPPMTRTNVIATCIPISAWVATPRRDPPITVTARDLMASIGSSARVRQAGSTPAATAVRAPAAAANIATRQSMLRSS
jgi:hypothetical protein